MSWLLFGLAGLGWGLIGWLIWGFLGSERDQEAEKAEYRPAHHGPKKENGHE